MTGRRRDLLGDVALVAAAAAIAKSATAQGPEIKIGKGLRDLSDETLDFFRMLGVRHVVMPSAYSLTQRRRGLVPATDTGPPQRRTHAAMGPRGASADQDAHREQGPRADDDSPRAGCIG